VGERAPEEEEERLVERDSSEPGLPTWDHASVLVYAISTRGSFATAWLTSALVHFVSIVAALIPGS
jgi:hypothetical protein